MFMVAQRQVSLAWEAQQWACTDEYLETATIYFPGGGSDTKFHWTYKNFMQKRN